MVVRVAEVQVGADGGIGAQLTEGVGVHAGGGEGSHYIQVPDMGVGRDQRGTRDVVKFGAAQSG